MTDRISVTQAVNQRKSIRGFLDKQVPEETVRQLLDKAARAPSGGNLQPWQIYVLMGDRLAAFKQQMMDTIKETPMTALPEYNVYPDPMPDIYKARSRKVGADMYELMGIARDDKQGRMAAMGRNFNFFDAPVGMFFCIDRVLDRNQWAHFGMFAQTLSLLAIEEGLGSCMQEAWAVHHEIVAEAINMPDTQMLWMGLALGYPDPAAPVNELETEREPVDGFAKFFK
ncbi:MAG: nitroreductase [Parvibaculales bacterium]